MQILLSHIVLSLLDPLIVPGQKDPNTLAIVLWFDDEGLRPLTVELLLEALGVRWQYPSLREEIIIFWHCFLHHVEIPRQQVLPCKVLNRWQMVSSLVPLHLVDKCWQNGPINPPNVPVLLLVIR